MARSRMHVAVLGHQTLQDARREPRWPFFVFFSGEIRREKRISRQSQQIDDLLRKVTQPRRCINTGGGGGVTGAKLGVCKQEAGRQDRRKKEKKSILEGYLTKMQAVRSCSTCAARASGQFLASPREFPRRRGAAGAQLLRYFCFSGGLFHACLKKNEDS